MTELPKTVTEIVHDDFNQFHDQLTEHISKEIYRTPSKPFSEGVSVVIEGSEYLGVFSVTNCRWIRKTKNGVSPYWCCDCIIFEDSGVVVRSAWSGPSNLLKRQE